MSLKLGNTNIAGTQVLYSTTGSNTDGAMTQAATTTQLSLKANDTDVVHKTGDETITGYKTFNRSVFIKNTDYAYNETPSSSSFTSLYIRDKNDALMGACELVKDTNGANFLQLNVLGSNGSWASAGLGLGVTSSGGTYTYCPASDVNGSIVTTVNKSKANRGYFQLGNGMIVQWGLDKIAANVTTANVTYPKAFTSASSYAVLTCHLGASQTQSMTRPANPSATGFTCNYNTTHTDARYFYWIAIGY